MSRKDQLRAALTRSPPELPDSNSASSSRSDPNETSAPRALVRSGAVGAMSRSLGQIATAAEEARALVAAGDKVVELDPGLVETSFVADRLRSTSLDNEALVQSIRNHGQQVPILVRPHPTSAGRYQVAYGHRRLRAAEELRLAVRAVVKELSDEELVIAQGQENSARTDLSYIERALFAAALEDRRFERPVIMAALNMEKTQLSRLIAVARSIPTQVANAIGPAPKAGRPRWTQLAEALRGHQEDEAVKSLLISPAFQTADSDARFNLLLTSLKSGGERLSAETERFWEDPEGRSVVRFDRAGGGARLTFDERLAPAFAEFVLKKLSELHSEYERLMQPTERAADTRSSRGARSKSRQLRAGQPAAKSTGDQG